MDGYNALLKELKYNEYTQRLSEAKDENESVEILTSFVRHVYYIISKSSLEKTVAILDFFNNKHSFFINFLLNSDDEKIFRALLILEKLNGIEPLMIKNNFLSALVTHRVKAETYNNKSMTNRDSYTKKYEHLKKYLDSKSNEEIERQLNEDLETFASNLSNVDNMLFFKSNRSSLPIRSDIINVLFDSDLSIETLSKVYNDVLLRNPLLKGFDYSSIILNAKNYYIKIKGLFRKCSPEIFALVANAEYDQENLEQCSQEFRTMIELNKDDKEGIRWFFEQLKSNPNKKLLSYLEGEGFFKEYENVNYDLLYEEALNKLLNGEKDIDQTLIESLGAYKGFIDNYNKLLDLFINSSDIEYQRVLGMLLTRGLIEIQKEKNGLEFKVVYTSKNVDSNTGGEYSRSKKTMYVNPAIFACTDNIKAAFVNACDTVFHETRHAYQFKMIETSTDMSFDNLLMAMDDILMRKDFSHYQENYQNISFERDAFEMAYVDTMTLFKNYPEMQQLVKKEYGEREPLTDFVRKDKITDSLCGITYKFIKDISVSFELIKKDKNTPYFETKLQEEKDLLNKYPVIKNFFDIDFEQLAIKPKSNEYFKDKLKEADSINDKETIYSIKTFLYAVNVSKYIEDNSFEYMVDHKTEDEIKKDVIENVGTRPSK